MQRPEWQLCDTEADPLCLTNLAGAPAHAATQRNLTASLLSWRKATNDPWLLCQDEHGEACQICGGVGA
jgi:hypothetical protein